MPDEPGMAQCYTRIQRMRASGGSGVNLGYKPLAREEAASPDSIRFVKEFLPSHALKNNQAQTAIISYKEQIPLSVTYPREEATFSSGQSASQARWAQSWRKSWKGRAAMYAHSSLVA